MSFNRTLLPDPASYFESQGLILKGPRSSPWRTTSCQFHGGSDSMRIHLSKGAWVCMNCGEKGGDVLAYEMKSKNLDFVSACKALGCWQNDGLVPEAIKATPLTPRQAISVISFETSLVAVAATNLSHGYALSTTDCARLRTAASRVSKIQELFP